MKTILELFYYIESQERYVSGEYWLDGVEDQMRGTWNWASTGDLIVRNFWFPGEPNHETHHENCMETTHFYNGLWNDEECNYEQYCICERPFYL